MVPLDTGELVRRLSARAGVRALALMGSHARGDATPLSDVDLVCFVDGTPREPALEVREGRLLAVSEAGPAEVEQWFTSPLKATECIAGVREALALWDPDGLFARIQARARAFAWDERLLRAAGQYASHMLAGLTEEVQKGLQGLAAGDPGRLMNAAFGLSWLLCKALRVQRGILVSGDNTSVLDVIAAVGEGSRWSTLARGAFGTGEASVLSQRVEAGLALYEETAALLAQAILPADRPVIDHALSLIRGLPGARRQDRRAPLRSPRSGPRRQRAVGR